MQRQFRGEVDGQGQAGFTLLEMFIATIVLVVGIVGVAKLVPVAVGLNANNRRDSAALVIAQRELNYMIDQPLSSATFTDPQGVLCPTASTCDLGTPASPGTLEGSPVVMLGSRVSIDFTQAKVAGYNFTYSDPDDPSGAAYDIRWAVITFASGGNAFGKRFIVGVRSADGNAPFLPVTLDSMVEK